MTNTINQIIKEQLENRAVELLGVHLEEASELVFLKAYIENSSFEGLLRKQNFIACDYIVVDDYFYSKLIRMKSLEIIKSFIKVNVIVLIRRGETELRIFKGFSESIENK